MPTSGRYSRKHNWYSHSKLGYETSKSVQCTLLKGITVRLGEGAVPESEASLDGSCELSPGVTSYISSSIVGGNFRGKLQKESH